MAQEKSNGEELKLGIKLTIAIPAYNNAKTIAESIESALQQDYPNKQILVVDDCSKDNTVEIAKSYGVDVHVNKENYGIGRNLVNCIDLAKGRYVLFLCADDLFASTFVASDVVRIFDTSVRTGVINRWYYQFMDGKKGAVNAVRDGNLFISACCPSGMALRKDDLVGTNRIFIEMPTLVKEMLIKGWEWSTMEYDTVAVRLHPGGNTGTLSTYYNESPIVVWSDFLGADFKYPQGLIQLKNRAPQLVWREIINTVKINKSNLRDPLFWLCALIAVIVPTPILKRMTAYYRDKVSRSKSYIIKRPE